MMWGRTAAKRFAPISCISVILCVVVTCRDDVYIVSIVAYRVFRDDVAGVWRRCSGCMETM